MYYRGMIATALLAVGFLLLELRDFSGMVAQGAGPSRSAFLSSFFALVGCHGLHVSLGLVWLLTMMAQVFAKGYRADILRRMTVLRPVPAHAGHHLGRNFHRGLSEGGGHMSDAEFGLHLHDSDIGPGDEWADSRAIAEGIFGYRIGLGFSILLTVAGFFVSRTSLVWEPSIPVALMVLAVAQMGVHLVFFLHITSGPESYNHVLALAFGVLIVFLVIVGSLWIMSNLNHNMMPIERIMQMQH
jgi:cytochrome o ubiquinol oxidase operon protein cyoD